MGGPNFRPDSSFGSRCGRRFFGFLGRSGRTCALGNASPRGSVPDVASPDPSSLNLSNPRVAVSPPQSPTLDSSTPRATPCSSPLSTPPAALMTEFRIRPLPIFGRVRDGRKLGVRESSPTRGGQRKTPAQQRPSCVTRCAVPKRPLPDTCPQGHRACRPRAGPEDSGAPCSPDS